MGSGTLRQRTLGLEGRGYPAYKGLSGAHELPGGTLFLDHIQGDPFAAPSKLRFRVAMDDAGLPGELRDTPARKLALGDWLIRRAAAALAEGASRPSGSGRSGELRVDAGGQEVLERSAIRLEDAFVELRLEVGLPARGRRILGRAAAALLCDTLPEALSSALRWSPSGEAEGRAFVACVENQEAIRAALRARDLVAFVGNGAILPRRSGASQEPLAREQAVPFSSPPSLEVRLPVPHPDPETGAREWVGLGIPRGVTLIVGGGYHGKSTLLQAIERGVYPHVPGDGRERVVSDPDLVRIRAEDGRSVAGVDIRPFIDDLPGGRSTGGFDTEDASGSTSQAASIVEALEAGARGLLLDEDSCATNFMVRDARMQALVAREREPITPFVDRVRELWETRGVSTLLVMGGSGDYFEGADRVLALDAYRPRDATEEARAVAAERPTGRQREARAPWPAEEMRRAPDPKSIDPSRGRRPVKLDVRDRDRIDFGRTRLELRALEQLVDSSQTRAVAYAIHAAAERHMDGASVAELLDALEAEIDARGLDVLDPRANGAPRGAHPGNLARPRRHEIAAALNRLRGVRFANAGS